MSIKQHPNGFKLEFGSTVTILTTGVADTKHCKRINGQGIFTGVVLDESELKIRSPKHVSISVDGVSEYLESAETENVHSCCHEHKYCDIQKHHDEDHKGHKDACEVKKQEFVILSLTFPSFPFPPGQIVWISLDQIIALSVLCKN